MPLSQSYEFANGPNTKNGELIGRNPDSKVGFFGTVPITQPTVPATGGTVQHVIDALAAMGLVKKI